MRLVQIGTQSIPAVAAIALAVAFAGGSESALAKQDKKNSNGVVTIESQGARTFGGTRVPMPNVRLNASAQSARNRLLFFTAITATSTGRSRPGRASIRWYSLMAPASGPTRPRSTASLGFRPSS